MPESFDSKKVMDEIEECVEREVQGLALLQVDRFRALLNTLTVFQAGVQAAVPTPRSMIYSRYALNHVVTWIFEHCQVGGGGARVAIDQEASTAAATALRFAMDYDVLQSAYRQTYKHRWKVEMRQPLLRFTLKYGGGRDRDVLDHLNWQARQDTIFHGLVSGEPPPSRSSLASSIRRADPDTIEYVATHEAIEFAHRIAQSNLDATLPLEISNGVYTLGDSREVWSGLLTLAILHEMHCAAAGGALNSCVLRLSFAELVEAVSAHCAAEQATSRDVLRDLVLDEEMKLDLRAQPLVESGGLVFVVPRVCMALAWEACTLLLWSKHHDRAYSQYVTTYKKTLANDFAAEFKPKELQVSVMRRLSGIGGKEVGDADVAVYDAHQRYLALFEIKWLQPPEDTFEIITADERLMEGVEQAQRVADFVRLAPERALELLFPQHRSNPTPAKVESFVLCRGATGSEYVAGAAIPIYDYDASVSAVRSSSGSLREVCEGLSETLARPPGSPALSLVYDRLDICGWDIRVPGYGPPLSHSGGRNDPCWCNSGRKFKRCCGR